MLTRLLPEQISSFWDIIKYAIEESLPPVVGEHPDKINRILSSLLSGKSQCWASYVRNGESSKFEGIVITKILYDDVSDTRNFLIYCLYGYNPVNRTSWLNGLKSLAKYAKSKGCSQIVGYSEIDFIIKLADRLGGNTDFRFISFNVNEIVQKLNDLEV